MSKNVSVSVNGKHLIISNRLYIYTRLYLHIYMLILPSCFHYPFSVPLPSISCSNLKQWDDSSCSFMAGKFPFYSSSLLENATMGDGRGMYSITRDNIPPSFSSLINVFMSRMMDNTRTCFLDSLS